MASNALLLGRFTRRELAAQYAGSSLGMFWALLGPLCLLAIFSFVFGQIFRQRISGLGTDSYTLYVAVGLWPWMMFADGLQRATRSVQANGALIKKAAFPHVLVVIAAINSVFATHLAGFAIVLSALAAFGMGVSLSGLSLVLITCLTLYGLVLGLGAALAALQVVIRDVEQALTPALMMLHYLTPVLYPLSIIPEEYRRYLQLNPMTHLVQRFRDGFLLGQSPQASDLLLVLAAAGVAALGYAFFSRLSPHFEDFL